MELFDSFPPQFSEDPLQILQVIKSFERDEISSAQRKVGCIEIVVGLRWLHWEIRSEKSINNQENYILQLSEIISEQPSISCKVCLKLGGIHFICMCFSKITTHLENKFLDTDIVSIFAEGKHGTSSSGVMLLQTKICIVTSDNKVHNVTLEVEDSSISFLSPLLALSNRGMVL